jgi:hypothetical protein
MCLTVNRIRDKVNFKDAELAPHMREQMSAAAASQQLRLTGDSQCMFDLFVSHILQHGIIEYAHATASFSSTMRRGSDVADARVSSFASTW